MTSFPIHTAQTAPEGSRPVLLQFKEAFGLIPNVAGAIAGSPVLTRAFGELFETVHAGSFTEAEIQVLLLTNAVTNASAWAVAFHSFLGLKEGLAPADVQAIRERRPPRDGRVAALWAMARALIETRGHATARDVAAFEAAGFGRERALEMLAVTAASTITNYAASMAAPPLEDFLEEHRWAA